MRSLRSLIPIQHDGLQIIRFGEFLVERGAISREQLLRALMHHHLRGGRLGASIARLGFCPRAVVESLAHEYETLAAIEF